MKMRGMAAALALALGTVVSGGAANAATVVYDLTVNGCSSTCFGSGITSLGTVTVNDAGGALAFSVNLTNGATLNTNGNQTHHALVFDFGSTALNLGGLSFGSYFLNPSATGTLSGSTSGPFQDPPFGSNWDFAVNYTPSVSQGNGPTSYGFTLSDTLNNLSVSLLDSPAGSGTPTIYVAADVFANGNTGNVGGTLTGGGIPEPATWGLMIVGVAAMGAAMRHRRAMTLA